MQSEVNARRKFETAMANLRADMPLSSANYIVRFAPQRSKPNRKHDIAADILFPAMAQHGLSFRWRTDTGHNGKISITCVVSHKDGHSEQDTLSAIPRNINNRDMIDVFLSTIDYLRRYTLQNIIYGEYASELFHFNKYKGHENDQ